MPLKIKKNQRKYKFTFKRNPNNKLLSDNKTIFSNMHRRMHKVYRMQGTRRNQGTSVILWFDLFFFSFFFFDFLINKSKVRSSPRKSKMSQNTLLPFFPFLSYIEYSHPHTYWQWQERRTIWCNYTQSSKSMTTQDRQRIFSPYPRR